MAGFEARHASAEQHVFHIDTANSSVDFTWFNLYLGFTATGTAASDTMPLAGTLTLDVDVVDDTVQSVDFVSMEIDYAVTLENPAVMFTTALFDSSEGFPAGSVLRVQLPFNEAVASGNPVARFEPRMWILPGEGGTESGTGGDLTLTEPLFRFEGSGQYFDIPTPPEAVFQDGWPLDFGPYPSPAGTAFPATMPISPTETAPTPAGPNILNGTVEVTGDTLTFTGGFLSRGVGGAGDLQPVQIHDATLVARTLSPADLSGDGDIDDEDLGLFFSAFTGPDGGPSSNPAADLSNDGDVDDEDLGLAFSAFTGPLSPLVVPEPATAILLFGLFVGSRRRVGSK